ncbi:MAG: EF-P lysine aminoacylase EpmA [Thermoguttaceae bacterium]|nr:EF-P lysine aminoacylase EpmA [Thermoguttaceae bacterium]MDW8037920.1 EF-P lysine aminoacylase EpmA [Thermoguttaceae bacterium]
MPRPQDYLPTASWPVLRLRAELFARIRAFFTEEGFLEVDTPLLSADTVVDRHIDPLAVEVPGWGRRWLQTSPEFCMKRLLAAFGGPSSPVSSGQLAIYQICHVFRAEEFGPLHNPEFTMVEWYRVGQSMEEGMDFLSRLTDRLLGRGPVQKITYAEAFQRWVGLNPHNASAAELQAAVRAAGICPPESLRLDDRDGWLDLLLSFCVQPKLQGVWIVYDYPASQAALARIRPGPPPVAERFELFVDGLELANGYHELCDPEELRQRNRRTNQLRQADGKSPLPEESRLLAAMEAGLPPSVGVALGFDRLVMIAAGAKTLADVLPFPFDRA